MNYALDVDWILIDRLPPAGIERGFKNAVAPADRVLVMTNPEVSAVRDADRVIGLLEAEGKGPGGPDHQPVEPGHGQAWGHAFGGGCDRPAGD